MFYLSVSNWRKCTQNTYVRMLHVCIFKAGEEAEHLIKQCAVGSPFVTLFNVLLLLVFGRNVLGKV